MKSRMNERGTNRNNLTYPVLRVSPHFGEAFRPPRDDNDEDSPTDAYQIYRASKDRIMTVSVDWGDGELTNMMDNNASVTLTIRGLGRRPAYQRIVMQEEGMGPSRWLPELSVFWSTVTNPYPEYLATLQIITKSRQQQNHNSASTDLNDGAVILLERNLHVLPPPIDPFRYQLEDILWAHQMKRITPNNNNPSCSNAGYSNGASVSAETNGRRRRRGFGLELETVQLPPDEEHLAHPNTLRATIETTARTQDQNNPLWDRLLLWKVEPDLQVENATPFARLDLWKKLMTAFPDSRSLESLIPLVLGGRQEIAVMPSKAQDIDPNQLQNLSSPEYKSPAPPQELYYEFSTTDDTNQSSHDDYRDADQEIHGFINTILKSDQRSILCPTVSDIGMSASSIHVHVNICHPQAWPPRQSHDNDHRQLLLTRSTLSVVLQWIRFDGVIRQFCEAWMWRDRDLMALHATGPECLYPEVVWKQGTTTTTQSEKALDYWNVAGFVEHVYSAYNHPNGEQQKATSGKDDGNDSDEDSDCWSDDNVDQDDYSGGSLLFGRADPNHDRKDNNRDTTENASPWAQEQLPFFASVFDDEIIRKTLGRKCSLNLLALKKYGTVEMRRMHATLDADFVAAWTRFCVGFVEYFAKDRLASSDENLSLDLVKVCLEEAPDASKGLEQLIKTQNHATMEDLIELLSAGEHPIVSASTFRVLLKNAQKQCS